MREGKARLSERDFELHAAKSSAEHARSELEAAREMAAAELKKTQVREEPCMPPNEPYKEEGRRQRRSESWQHRPEVW